MHKNVLTIVFFFIVTLVKAQSPVYILEFLNPSQTATTLTWEVWIRAANQGSPAVTSFTLLGGNIRYQYNNMGLSTSIVPSFSPSTGIQIDGMPNFLSVGSQTIAGLNFSVTDFVSGVVVNTTGVQIGTVTHTKNMALPTGTLASVVIREFNVFGGYSPTPPLLTPIEQEGNCTLIYTRSNPDEFTPARPAQPTNLAPDISLPITIKEFSVSKLNENSAILDWTSSSEINSSHFEIERSLDVENFEFVGSVQAAGNSSVELKYEFIDKKIPSLRSRSNVYYRLKMFDLDGTFKYSDIRGVNFSNDQMSGVAMYPNPTSQWVNLDINASEFAEESGNVQIFDSVGKLVFTKKVIGKGIETVDMGSWNNGVYHVILTQGDKMFREKIVKID
jgi:hypothetical protein